MIPSLSYLAFAFLLVIFGTRNGRALLFGHSLELIRNGILYIPYPLRRRIFAMILSTPLPFSKRILDFASKPQGKQKGWIRKVQKSSFTAHWIGPGVATQTLDTVENDASDLDLIVMYCHGGGFTVGNSTMYMPSFMLMVDRMKQQHGINARILSVEYPLALESPYPKAQESCLGAYQYLVHELSISPSRIVLAGDSAGGWLVITTLLTLSGQRTQRQQESLPPLPSPAGCVMISPWVALHSGSPTYKSNHGHDVVTQWQLDRHVSYYLPDSNKLDSNQRHDLLMQPSLSPVYATFTDISCPFLVTYSDCEVLQFDILRFIDNLRRDKVKTDVLCRPDQSHIWVIEASFATTPDIWKEDLAKAADWMVKCIAK
ncbi:unnamed protein product [Absidia cylindrospora]